MKYKDIPNPSNKLLRVYDDAFTYSECEEFLKYILHSMYRINGLDGEASNASRQIYSAYTEEDFQRMKFMDTDFFKSVSTEFNLLKRKIGQIRVNCSTFAEYQSVHTDTTVGGITMLYYANLNWKHEWSGHTLLLDDIAGDSIYTCIYRPNRVVLFDGSIPHLILTPNFQAPEHRYTFVVQYFSETEGD